MAEARAARGDDSVSLPPTVLKPEHVHKPVTVLRGARRWDGVDEDLVISDGRFVAPGAYSDGPQTVVLDARGLLALPTFVDPHVHLDKTFVGEKWISHRPGTDLADRIAIEIQALDGTATATATATATGPRARTTVDRAIALSHLAISRGTKALRSHVDVSMGTGLTRLEGVLTAREQLAGQVEISIVAFPQEGILASPGTAELLDEALASGADTVGGLDPQGFDGDRSQHLDVVFSIAQHHGARVDIHLHELGVTGIDTLDDIAARTSALGMSGKVCVSHAFALATSPTLLVDQCASRLAEAGVGIITSVPGEQLCPPIGRLRELGVVVAVGSDNIRDSWSPFGRADQLERIYLAAYLSGWRSDQELEDAFELGTVAPRALTGLSPGTFQPGDPADLVLVHAENIVEAIVEHRDERTVFSAGVIAAGPPLSHWPGPFP